MDQLVTEHKYGALWELRVSHHQHTHHTIVPVLTLMSLGHIKSPRSSTMIISVTLEIQDLWIIIQLHTTQKTLSGMVRGVVLLARAVPSTPLPGSASLSLNLPVMTWR